MKRRNFIGKTSLVATMLALTGAFTPFAFAAPGKSLVLSGDNVTPRIIIATNAVDSEKYASQELSEYLGKITGKTVETVVSDVAPPASSAAPVIILGHHSQNADLEPGKLALEESIVSIEENRLRIVGGKETPIVMPNKTLRARDRGTLYGAYHFLNSLGVRWYRPEPWGEHVPQLKTIDLPFGKKTYKPAYKYRHSNNLYRWFADQTKEQSEMATTWAVRNFVNTNTSAGDKRGGAYVVHIAHAYSGLIHPGKYFKDHPEYFALINGKRERTGQPCLGNPEVIDIMAKAVIARAKANPNLDTISLSPNDGTAWCECELCRALDDPKLLAPNGGEARLGKVSMTNRVAHAHNIIAKRLAQEVPGAKVAWYAYLSTSETPTLVDKLEPNIIAAPTSMAAAYGNYSKLLDDPKARGNVNFKGILEGWSAMAPLVTREYWSGGCWYGPIPLLTVLQDRLQQYRKYRVEGTINECHPSWGPQTDLHYFAAQLLWNPDLDMQKELELFCENYYGPAAKPMLQYHRLLEKASLNGPDWFFSGRFIDRLFVDEKLIEEMGRLIGQAKPLAEGKEPYARRFHGAWAGYEVARVRCQVEQYKKQKRPLQAVAAWDELEKFVKSDTTGELFNSGPVLSRTIWRVMTDQAGIGGMRKQIEKLKANPKAALLQNLSEDWKFSTDPTGQGLAKAVFASKFDDSKWSAISTNGTWQDQGFNYLGTAWYRRELNLPKKEENAKYSLLFGAVDGDAIIYLNGQEVGRHLLSSTGDGWNDDFEIDITKVVKPGKNSIAVQVTKTSAVAGIHKGVVLMRQ